MERIMYISPLEIEHWGVLGMKWGVRRSEKQLARERAKREKDQKAFEDDLDEVRRSVDPKVVARNRHRLTDIELRERISRINMERQIKDLSNKMNKDVYDKVKTLVDYGKLANEVYSLGTSPLAKAIMKKVKKKATSE